MASTDPPQKLATVNDATSVLLSHMLSRAPGSAAGKRLSYSMLKEDTTSFTFSAALEGQNDNRKPIDRYRVVVDRLTGKVVLSELITLSEDELADAVLNRSGHHLATFTRLTDGALSMSYKVSIKEDPNTEYILQLRHHGYVPSMDTLLRLISSSIDDHVLPVPTVYPTKDGEVQRIRGMGLQMSRFIPGIMGDIAYPRLSHEQKLSLLRRLALAIDAVWSIPIPGERLIGELKATYGNDSQIVLSVGPDRYYSLGGPFTSVADYLRAFIHAHLRLFQKQQGIDEYKNKYLPLVTAFVEKGMQNIPSVVEQIPVVSMHQDLGLHNVILSSANPTVIESIIDWEFCASAPYASLHDVIERLFRVVGHNGFGAEYQNADELRSTFWGTIPKWENWNESEATKVFLEWYRFALFMKAEWRPDDLEGAEKEAYWAENVRVVEGFLVKYSQ